MRVGTERSDINGGTTTLKSVFWARNAIRDRKYGTFGDCLKSSFIHMQVVVRFTTFIVVAWRLRWAVTILQFESSLHFSASTPSYRGGVMDMRINNSKRICVCEWAIFALMMRMLVGDESDVCNIPDDFMYCWPIHKQTLVFSACFVIICTLSGKLPRRSPNPKMLQVKHS